MESVTPLDGLDHVALTVRDVAESVAWYERALGLTRRHEEVWGDFPAVVGVGDTSLALFPVGTDDPKPPPGKGTLAIRHIAFRASRAGFVAAQARLAQYDVPFRAEDHQIAHSVYCVDPNGHEIEITTYEI